MTDVPPEAGQRNAVPEAGQRNAAPEAGQRGKGIAPRREMLILLPAALLLLALLSTYALLSYRSAVVLLIEERQAEATRLARQLSGELASMRSLPTGEALRRRLPQANSVSILENAGAGTAATARSPAAADVIAGTARFRREEKVLAVQVELPGALLRSRQRGLKILTPLLLTVNGAVTLLVLLFLRRFLAPFDQLVEKARHAGQEIPESQDEVVFLVETFEKALAALARPADSSEIDELKALESTLARSLESGVLLLDARGVVLALNEIGASLLQVDAARTGDPVSAHLGRHPTLVALLERAVRRGEPVQREECAIESGAGERILGVTAHPLRRGDAALRGFLVIFADLTEVQKEIQERQLVDSLAQLGELTAGVAHELRNSLATLRGYLTLVERGRGTDSIDDYLGEIRRESDHLQRVLEDFLMFARPGSARPEEADLVGLVHRAAADPALGQTAVTVEAGDGDGAPDLRVWGDSQLLERAVRNVLSNAVEAQRDAGRRRPVRARLEVRGAGVEIEIADRGGGLSPEARERLFDPFFSQRPGGVGMGLALTRRIVLLHAGRIAVEDRKGGGTRATLWIPFGKIVTKGNESVEEGAREKPVDSAQTADRIDT